MGSAFGLAALNPRRWHMPAGYAALKHRNFRLFWLGQAVTLIGNWMQNVAQGWLVYQLTGSAFSLGLVGATASLPVLLFSLAGGILADRFDRRRLMLFTQYLAMAQAFAMATLIWSGHIQVWHVYVLTFVLGTINAIGMPVRQAFVVELVDRDDLPNAIALNSTVFNLARVIGPAVAAGLLVTVGIAGAYFVNGITYTAVIVMLWMVRLPLRPSAANGHSVADNLREGFAYIRSDPPTLALMALVAVVGLFGIPYATLMPVFADQVLHTDVQGYSNLLVATGLGALVAAFWLASLRTLRHKGWLLTAGDLVFPAMLMIFSLMRWMPLALIMLFLIGGFLMLRAAISNILLQVTVPDELRGRVMSVYTMLFFGMTPFGSFQAGWVAEHFGAPVAIFVGALLVWLAAIFVFLRFPDVRRLP